MEEIKTKKWSVEVLLAILILAAISILIGIFTDLSYLESFRIVFGSVYVLFLPGLIISFIFFPETKPFEEDDKGKLKHEETESKGAIDWIERVALSFALSIAIVPLVVFYLNLIGIKINLINSFFTILGIIVISIIILLIKNRKLNNDQHRPYY